MLLIWDMSHWVIELSWLIVIYLSQWFWIHCIYDCISLFFNQPTQVIKQQRFYFCDSWEQWSQNNTIISLEKSVNFKLLFSNSVCVLCQWKTKSPFCFGTFYILHRMFDTLTKLSNLFLTHLNSPACFQQEGTIISVSSGGSLFLVKIIENGGKSYPVGRTIVVTPSSMLHTDIP